MTGDNASWRTGVRRWTAIAAVAVLCSYLGLLQHVATHDGQVGEATCLLCAVGDQPAGLAVVGTVPELHGLHDPALFLAEASPRPGVILASQPRGPPELA